VTESSQRRHPLLALTDEELEFVMRMVMASGSLKELARAYGVSYPTIRARLNRLIARLEVIVKGRPISPMAELLGNLVERGELSLGGARSVLKLHRKENRPTKEA